jgi:hypothetical protein
MVKKSLFAACDVSAVSLYLSTNGKRFNGRGGKMEIQANQMSRDWTILHNGRKFYINFTDSDSQTLALLNRDNWEIFEETDDGSQELDVYIFKNSTPQQKEIAEENIRLAEELIKFCIKNWDNKFMQEIKKDMQRLISVSYTDSQYN